MDDFERLCAIVDTDDEFQQRLLALNDSASFIRAVLDLAAEHELVVPEGRIWQAIEHGRAAWYATWSA